jgi:hypothetical protein
MTASTTPSSTSPSLDASTTSKGGELGALGIEASAEVRYTGWPVYTYDGTNAKTILYQLFSA